MVMSGCTSANQAWHIGLQQLAALAAAGNAFLGPNKKCKFVEDQESGESNLVCSPYRLLEQLDLSCAAGQLLSESVQAHQEVFGTGTGCLLFMAGVWSTVALECLQDGVPVQHIVSAMLEGLGSCLEASRGIRVPIKEAICHFGSEADKRPNRHRVPIGKDCFIQSTSVCFLSSSHDASRLGTCRPGSRKTHQAETHKPQAGKLKIKLTHSRHLWQGEKTETGSSVSAMMPPLSGELEPMDIICLAASLSHGCEDRMSLAVEACRIQMECRRLAGCSGTFDVSKLVTCVLPGLPEECATILRGFLTLISEEQAQIARLLEDRSLCVAVINGDVSESSRHLGFCRPLHIRHTIGKLDALGFHSESKWAAKTLMTLQRLNVDVLLVGGMIVEDLRQSCLEKGLLVVERVMRSVLLDIAETTGAVPVTYVSQLHEGCVGKGARASIWRQCGKAVAVNIHVDRTLLVTAVIASCVSSKLQMLEDQFWGCAHRLYNTMGDGHVLPGAGVTEIFCTHHLRELSKLDANQTCPLQESKSYRSVVLRHMAEGWVEYVATVMCNTAVCTSKLEALTVIGQSLKELRAGKLPCSSHLHNLHNDGGGMVVILDNVEAKLEAWRKALDLVLLVLQTDTEIITGLSTKDAEQESHLIVL